MTNVAPTLSHFRSRALHGKTHQKSCSLSLFLTKFDLPNIFLAEFMNFTRNSLNDFYDFDVSEDVDTKSVQYSKT